MDEDIYLDIVGEQQDGRLITVPTKQMADIPLIQKILAVALCVLCLFMFIVMICVILLASGQHSNTDKSTTGLQGPKYNAVLQGLKGDVGPPGTGNKGNTGLKGLKGDVGPPGSKGGTGRQGLKGDAGPPGPKGSTRLQGLKGDAGPPEPSGQVGTGDAAFIGFSMYHSKGSYTQTASKPDALHFDQLHFNIGAALDPITSIFTAPINGIYFFTFCLQKFYGTEDLDAQLKMNGDVLLVLDIDVDEGDVREISGVFQLQQGDRVWVQMIPNRRMNCVEQSSCRFDGYLVHH